MIIISEKEWLKSGIKTQVTPTVKRIADSIPGIGLEYVKNVSDYLQSIYPSSEELNILNIELPDKRLRSADELLNSSLEGLSNKNIISGCIEIATIFRALCLAKNIPCVFVETIREVWKNDNTSFFPVQGHVFVDVYVDEYWHTINPANIEWHRRYKDYFLSGQGKYLVIGRGLDSHDLGFDNMDNFYLWLAKKYSKTRLLK